MQRSMSISNSFGAFSTWAFGPVASTVQAEWRHDGARRDELRSLAAASGGAERLDLRDVWSAPQPGGELDLSRWLLIAALAVAVGDALLTQLGVRLWRERAETRG